jgi:endonuclease YncB( thermonuclease family)
MRATHCGPHDGPSRLEPSGKNKYGRTISDVLLPDGTNVNHTLVKDGSCWWYRKYAPGDTVLEGVEKGTREARKGLWSEPHMVCRGNGGAGKSVKRQTLLRGVTALGFSQRSSQRDTDFRG